MEYGGEGDTNCNWHTLNGPRQRIIKGAGRVWNRIFVISQNNVKCPGHLRKPDVTQISLKEWVDTGVKNWQKVKYGSPSISQTTKPRDGQHKKKNLSIVDFAVPADNSVKLKESKKGDMFLDIAREREKKLWKMMVTVIPIDALITIIKGTKDDLEIRGRVETIQSTALLRSARIMETWGNLLSLKLQWKTIS